MCKQLHFTRVSFSGHETFPLRSGWLKKGLEAIQEDRRIFSDQDDAITRLGVGKNMVRSIRHWCLATRILEEVIETSGRRLQPSELGRQLLGENGFDPYLEDIGTLWLLHWQLASNRERATTWYSVFSGWHQMEFTKEEIVRWLLGLLEDDGITHVAEVSIRRDIDCFIRTYVPTKTTNTLVLEDTLDCPLIELQLVGELSDRKVYRLHRGANPTLPDLILAYAIADYWEREIGPRTTVSFEDVAYKHGSPGRLLRLEENALVGRLEKIETITRGAFSYSSSTGLRQLYRGARQLASPLDLLEDYYVHPQKG